jgi:hypothetical protein
MNHALAGQFRLLIDCYGLVLHPKLGCMLDGRPNCTTVEYIRLSDDFLLRLEVNRPRTRDLRSAITIRSHP